MLSTRRSQRLMMRRRDNTSQVDYPTMEQTLLAREIVFSFMVATVHPKIASPPPRHTVFKSILMLVNHVSQLMCATVLNLPTAPQNIPSKKYNIHRSKHTPHTNWFEDLIAPNLNMRQEIVFVFESRVVRPSNPVF